MADATAVDAMTEPPHPDQDADQFWAWIDQQAGTVRARVFAARYGVPQDEACGSASMLLAAHLGRAITIQHGSGSLVQASPAPNGMADVGGRVVLGPRACRRLATMGPALAPSTPRRAVITAAPSVSCPSVVSYFGPGSDKEPSKILGELPRIDH